MTSQGYNELIQTICSPIFTKTALQAMYAVSHRVNLSSCSEAQPTAPIDVQKLIVDEDDLTLVTDDAIVLIARYSFI